MRGRPCGIAALILSTLLTTLYMLTIVVRAYFPVGELDRAALARVHDPARTMWIPLVLLTASGSRRPKPKTPGSCCPPK